MQYLANFETSAGQFCQGLVHFPADPRGQTFYPSRWFSRLNRLREARNAVPGCEVSLRTSIRTGRLDNLAFFRVPVASEGELRHYLASFLGLLTLVDGSIMLPSNRRLHDNLARPWARHLCRIETQRYTAGDSWLACDFRVLDFLPGLLAEAEAAGHDLFHQVNLQSFFITSDQERRARRNLVAIERMKGVPAVVIALENRLLNRSFGKVELAEEFVGTASQAGVAWLSQALEQRFSAKLGRAKFETPIFEFQVNRFGQFLNRGTEHTEAVTAGFHPAAFQTPRDEEIFSTVIDSRDALSLFDWRERFARWFEPLIPSQQATLRSAFDQRETAERREATLALAEIVSYQSPFTICQESSHYAFISYRRADFGRVAPILHDLNSAGCPYWFDRDVPGGEQWLGELQNRLFNAGAVVLFLSRIAAESRYVQLEANYAFSLGKPILPVRLEDIDLKQLPGGLGLLLSSIQTIDARIEEIMRHLDKYGLQI